MTVSRAQWDKFYEHLGKSTNNTVPARTVACPRDLVQFLAPRLTYDEFVREYLPELIYQIGEQRNSFRKT